MLVLPSDTLPKATAEGLALSAFEDTEFDVAALEFVADDVETPFALVTPVQPVRIMADAKRVEVRKRSRTREVGRACGSIEENRECELRGRVSMTHGV